MSRANGLPGYDAWKTRSDLDEEDRLSRGAAYACDWCGEWVPKSECEMDNRGWLFCPKCCGKAEENDPSADWADWEYERDR